jgi:GH15 family glucan-1,4-alpha-glucosidase
MRAFADHVTANWMDPDAGIWERRDSPRHHVHSKLMAWLALDRAIRIAEKRGGSPRHSRVWRAAAQHLGEDIHHRGYDLEIGSYTAAYDLGDLDAALLLLSAVGFEAPPRVTGTIEAVRRRLGAGGPLLFRYRNKDGLPGGEGALLPLPSGLSRPSPRPAAAPKPKPSSKSCSDTAAHSVSTARRWIPSHTSTWVTFPKP